MCARPSFVPSTHLRQTCPSRVSFAGTPSPSGVEPVPDSVCTRVILLLVAGVHVFFTAGVVFGWTALAQVLSRNGTGCEGKDCSGQAALFAFVFTLGTIGNYTSNLPFGVVLDTFGPKICCVLGSCVQLTGAAMMYMHSTGGPMLCLYVGYFLLGFGGTGIQTATFHLANLFPNIQGTLLAASTAIFDGSTIVFPIFYSLTESGLDLSSCWIGYAGIVAVILVSGALLWPSLPFAPPTPSAAELSAAAEPAASSKSLGSQLLSRPYIYLVLFACVHLLRLNFAVATFATQVASLGFDDAQVEGYVITFGRLLPFGFVGMPLIGYLLDNSSPVVVFALINLSGVLNSSLILVPESPSTLMGAIGCIAVGRQFVYSTFFAQLQRSSSPSTFGTLAGIANLFVALSGLCLSPLATLATTFESWGLYSYAPANLIVIALMLPLFTQPLSCWKDPASSLNEKLLP